MKKCSSCKDYLDDDKFSLYKGRLQSFCKECQKKYSKEYRQDNKESCKKNLQEWRKVNKSSRVLTEQQINEEKFRAKIRSFLKTKGKKPHEVFGYTAKDLKKLAEKTLGKKPFKIKYKIPLSEFDLTKIEDQRKAASLDNLLFELK